MNRTGICASILRIEFALRQSVSCPELFCLTPLPPSPLSCDSPEHCAKAERGMKV